MIIGEEGKEKGGEKGEEEAGTEREKKKEAKGMRENKKEQRGTRDEAKVGNGMVRNEPRHRWVKGQLRNQFCRHADTACVPQCSSNVFQHIWQAQKCP